MEAMDSSLISMVTVNDYNAADHFTDDTKPPKSPHEHMKKVSDRYQAEAYYFEVLYGIDSLLSTRLEKFINWEINLLLRTFCKP